MFVRGRKTMVFFLSVLLLLLLPPPVFSDPSDKAGRGTRTHRTIIVNASGSADYTHIQWAIDNASDGDTVFVEAGTYYENVVVDRAINLVGAGSGNTTIDGNRKGDVVLVQADHVNIHDFNITNSGYDHYDAGIKIYSVSNCRIEKTVCSNNFNYGLHVYRSSSSTMINNTCSNNSNYGILIENSFNNYIIDNICDSNYYLGIVLHQSTNNTITNNTCDSNRLSGICLDDCINNTMRYNKIYGGGIWVRGHREHHSSNTIDTTNTVNGKSVCYWKNVAGGRVPSESGQVILANCTDVIVESLNISNCQSAISVDFSTNITIRNNSCVNNNFGLSLYESSNNSIYNNSFFNNTRDGIKIFSGRRNHIINNTFDSNNDGIWIWKSNDNIIRNNTIINDTEHLIEEGNIRLYESLNNTLENNTMTDNGISIKSDSLEHWNTHDIDTSNLVNGKPIQYWKNTNGETIPYGSGQVILVNCSEVVVENQNVSNTYVGIGVYFSTYCVIINNTCTANRLSGIHIDSSDNNDIINNTCSSNSRNGIYLYDSSNNDITNNLCNDNSWDGICFEGDYWNNENNNNNITNNTCNSNDDGITLRGINNNIIDNNTCNSNYDGIRLADSIRNTVTNNTLYSSSGAAVKLYDSQDIILGNNVMLESGISISGHWPRYWETHTISTSNLVNGKPVHYLNNVVEETIPQGAGQVILVNCENVTVKNLNVSNGSVGIQISHSSHITIRNNICNSNNGRGIYLQHSDNCTIMNNICDSNYDGITLHYYTMDTIVLENTCNSNRMDGILIGDGKRNSILENTCHHNREGISVWSDLTIVADNYFESNEKGIKLNGDNNTISDNIFSKNDVGIYSDYGYYNIIANNTCVSNADYSISLEKWAENNVIHHNNFIHNNVGKKQAFDNGTNNRWYVSGEGNYWSDLTMPDDNLDGIVDIPYLIDGTAANRDNYPLVLPIYLSLEFVNPDEDIVITENTYVVFDASEPGNDRPIVNYTWSFFYDGEEILLYGASPVFEFKESGIYEINLTSIDNDGNMTYDSAMVTVLPDEDVPVDVDTRTYFWIGIIALFFLIIAAWLLVWKSRKNKTFGKETEEKDHK